MATLQPIRCVDDCGNVPARVEHAPALLLNCEADSLVLLSATAARLQRLIHGLDVYVMNSSDEAIACFDPGSMHNALMAAYLQCTEVHQMVLGTLEKIAEDRGV